MLFVFLAPFLFFLHPLVTTIYFVLAAVSAYIAYQQPGERRAATVSMILFLLMAVTRGIYSFFTLSLYEVGFESAGQVQDYFLIRRFENLLFLCTAMEIAVLVLLSPSIANPRWQAMKMAPRFISLQSCALFLFAASFLLRGNLLLLVITGCLGVPAFLALLQSQQRPPTEQMRVLYPACAFLAAASSSLLLAQYASAEREFTLKMGLDLFTALAIMAIATVDSIHIIRPYERNLRFKLVGALSIIFACVTITKSILWQTSVLRLEQTLQETKATCVEMTSVDFPWLSKSPYTIINNWALPSLALVLQDHRPRKALLAQNNCEVLSQTGTIQLDPWSLFSKEFLVPPLE
jgi:hypothetical protein